MPNTKDGSRTIKAIRNAVLAVLVVIGGAPAEAVAMDVTVANQAVRQIDGLYLSATAQSDWGPDQLNGTAFAPNGSWTIRSDTPRDCGR